MTPSASRTPPAGAPGPDPTVRLAAGPPEAAGVDVLGVEAVGVDVIGVDVAGVSATTLDAAEVTAARRDAGIALGWVVGIGAGGLALAGLYAGTGWGLGCPVKALTGWDCPLCGGTRMGAALLRGDLPRAWHLNPAALIALVLMGVGGAALLIERALGRAGTMALRVRSLGRRHLGAHAGQRVTLVVLAVMLMWFVFRNVVLGPLP